MVVVSRVAAASNAWKRWTSPRIPAQGPHCAGELLLARVRALSTLAPRERVDEALAQAAPELADAIKHGAIIPSGRYPLGWLRALHAAGEHGLTGEDLSRRLGYAAARIGRSGVTDARGAVPGDALLAALPALLTQHHPSATHSVHELSPTRVRFAVRDAEGFDRRLWHGLLGACECLLEMRHAELVRVRFVAGGRDADTAATIACFWSLARE